MLTASTMVLRRKFDPGERARDDRARADRQRPDGARDAPADPRPRRRGARAHDTDSLRTVPVSGSALSGDLAKRFMDEFGEVVYNLYGSTEVAWVAIASPKDLLEAPGTAGAPAARHRAEHPRRRQPAGADRRDRPHLRQELDALRGLHRRRPKDMVDGMMATGDVGHLDEEGRLFVEGRDDDMIVSGGENVFPQEVEETARQAPQGRRGRGDRRRRREVGPGAEGVRRQEGLRLPRRRSRSTSRRTSPATRSRARSSSSTSSRATPRARCSRASSKKTTTTDRVASRS